MYHNSRQKINKLKNNNCNSLHALSISLTPTKYLITPTSMALQLLVTQNNELRRRYNRSGAGGIPVEEELTEIDMLVLSLMGEEPVSGIRGLAATPLGPVENTAQDPGANGNPNSSGTTTRTETARRPNSRQRRRTLRLPIAPMPDPIVLSDSTGDEAPNYPPRIDMTATRAAETITFAPGSPLEVEGMIFLALSFLLTDIWVPI